jgi:uncharacterized protein YcbK (DUF882 family)
MIDLKTYLMGRDKIYTLNEQQKRNAIKLLEKINALFSELKIKVSLSSGYRPGHFNKAAGGSARSGHLTCEAIDLADLDGSLKEKITLELLEKYDLYMENGDYTRSWVHLQTRKTRNRVFNPY